MKAIVRLFVATTLVFGSAGVTVGLGASAASALPTYAGLVDGQVIPEFGLFAETDVTTDSVLFIGASGAKGIAVKRIVSSIGDCASPAAQCSLVRIESLANPNPTVVATLKFATQPPLVVPGSTRVAERNSGTATVQIPVTLSYGSTKSVTVNWHTVRVPGAPADQADPTNDYVPASGTVTFTPGVQTRSVGVAVKGDVIVEPDEYFVVQFDHPTNAAIGGFWGLGFGQIVNDDASPTEGTSSSARRLRRGLDLEERDGFRVAGEGQ